MGTKKVHVVNSTVSNKVGLGEVTTHAQVYGKWAGAKTLYAEFEIRMRLVGHSLKAGTLQ